MAISGLLGENLFAGGVGLSSASKKDEGKEREDGMSEAAIWYGTVGGSGNIYLLVYATRVVLYFPPIAMETLLNTNGTVRRPEIGRSWRGGVVSGLVMRLVELEKSVRVLAPLLSDARRQRIASVVEKRTSSLAVLLENVGDRGNRNAVLRSMDSFGVYMLHTLNYGKGNVEMARKKCIKSEMRTDAGARDWLITKEWSDVEQCLHKLKEAGYRIASAVPDATRQLVDINFTQRLVVAFGNEHVGVSDALLKKSDLHFSIPMIGFVQSLNLSVCVAVTLHQAYSQRTSLLVRDGPLQCHYILT